MADSTTLDYLVGLTIAKVTLDKVSRYASDDDEVTLLFTDGSSMRFIAAQGNDLAAPVIGFDMRGVDDEEYNG